MPESENQIGVKFDDSTVQQMGIATMSTIPSVLIRTCMLNIQKELRQLEHWLNTLPAESVPSTTPASANPDNTVLSTLEKLSRQYEVQQHALNHIVDRLDMLEEEREVQHINHEEKTDPWLDSSSSYLENTIVDPLEPIYLVRKEVEPVLTPSAVTLSSILHTVVQSGAKEEPKEEPNEEPKEEPKEEPQEESEEEPKEEPKEEPQEEPEEEPKEKPKEEPQEEPEEEPHEEPEEEHEEEEEGVELAEVTFKGKTYYKDPEGFIYGIDEEGQPTEQPIGVWKEKSSSVAFYRT